MANQKELDRCYMEVAQSHAKLSKSKRKKVGVAIVTKHGIILGGTNGMSPNGSNDLEYKDSEGNLVTKDKVIHAELNAVLKAAREGVSLVGSTLYSTLSCCERCSEMVAAAGITRVVYEEEYREFDGIQNLKSLGIGVEMWEHQD